MKPTLQPPQPLALPPWGGSRSNNSPQPRRSSTLAAARRFLSSEASAETATERRQRSRSAVASKSAAVQVAPEALAAAYETLKGTRALLESAGSAQAARELQELDSNSRTMQLLRSIAQPNPDISLHPILNPGQNPPREQAAAATHRPSRASRPSIVRTVSFLAPGQQAALDAADEPPVHKPRRLTAARDDAPDGPAASSAHADVAPYEEPLMHVVGLTGSSSASVPTAWRRSADRSRRSCVRVSRC